MKKITIAFALLIVTISVYAQDFRLGKVSIGELEEKVHPADTSAAAAILFKRGKTFFEISDNYPVLVTSVETRIKIYKKEGYAYANEELVYYSGGRTQRVYFTDAYTYNVVGGKVEKTKLKSDGEFEEQLNEEYTVKKMTMPNVKEGSVIEYKYIIKTPYYSYFRDWPFQYDIPANHIEYEISVPDFLAYNRYMGGYLTINQSEPYTRPGLGSRFNETVTTFSVKNVKALKDEAYVNNIKNYMAILKHELASTHFPNSSPEYFSTDWEAVSKKIYEHEDFGRELRMNSYFEEDMAAVLKGIVPPAERMNAIFNYVQTRMNWNEEFGYYCDKGVKKAYNDRVGNVAEINLMLTAMLRKDGFNANPVLISTRANGVALFPNRLAYNYVVAGVVLSSGETVLLDATSKNTSPGILPIRALNWIGRMIRENNTSAEIDLMPKINSKEIIQIAANIDAEGKISGKLRDQYYDYNAFIFRENNSGTSQDSYIEGLEKTYKGLEIGDYSSTNVKDLGKPITEEYSFTNNNVSDVIGDKIYINPLLFLTRTQNPFKQEVREYPVDFTIPQQDKYMINLTVPEGYVVEHLPTPIALAMEENIGNFSYNIAAKGKQVQVSVIFNINYPNVSPAYYATIKDFWKKMIEKQNEKIILKRV